jgi:transposase
MEVMFDRVAGLDVGKESVTVCVRTPGSRRGRHSETRTFKTMTGSLRVMRDWLVESGVTIAAMESTSAFWKPPVRHEALWNRVEVRRLRRWPVAAGQ